MQRFDPIPFHLIRRLYGAVFFGQGIALTSMNVPKSLRLHIGIFGRRNVGKSSLLNAITQQTVSIVSAQAGSTTDPVEKPMELLPLGPVLFIDTAGLDDEGELGSLRVEKTHRAFDRCDFALVLTDGPWAEHENAIVEELDKRNIPWVAVLTKADIVDHASLSQKLIDEGKHVVKLSTASREDMEELIRAIIRFAPEGFLDSTKIIADMLPEKAHVVLVVPIDKEAPKGRLIMPQVQTIRDILDAHCVCTVCQEPQLSRVLESFKTPPDMVVTDSQAFKSVSEIVPRSIPLTGFSVLFARFKGDLSSFVQGANAIRALKAGDRVLIAEACTHHPVKDDIGRVKIPRLLERFVGGPVNIDVVSGQEFPEDLTPYSLIIHCGGCMWNRRQMLSRQQRAKSQHVPMTNYGIAIAALTGILDRAIQPFGV